MTEYEQTIVIGSVSGRGVLLYKFDHTPSNLAVVCQRCGDVWCKMLVHCGEQTKNGFTPVSHLCANCNGGMLSNFIPEYRDFSLPDELLFRELELYYENPKRLAYAGSTYV